MHMQQMLLIQTQSYHVLLNSDKNNFKSNYRYTLPIFNLTGKLEIWTDTDSFEYNSM